MQITFSPARLCGTLAAPPSKSEAHRRLLCAGLSQGETRLSGYMSSRDTDATAQCLRTLGAKIQCQGDSITVVGKAVRPDLLPIYDCGESGSTLRFFVPMALALTHGGVFRMHGRLAQRPMDVYRQLFVPRGVLWHMGVGADGTAELTVTGSLESGHFVLPGDVSSQFVSGLLFALPLLSSASTLLVQPPLESFSYIRMTVQALRDSGITVDETGPASWRIPGNQQFRAQGGPLHGDWSQAAVPLCMGALSGDVTVTGLSPDSIQGDRAVVRCLEALGARPRWEGEALRITSDAPLHGAALDMQDTPDIAPLLALVCQLAEGESRLSHCSRLRLKESDRLATTVSLLNALGGDARTEGDTLIIRGVKQLRGGVELPRLADHRMVMLASAAALRADGPVTVPDAEVLAKSWPDYLTAYRSLGGIAE